MSVIVVFFLVLFMPQQPPAALAQTEALTGKKDQRDHFGHTWLESYFLMEGGKSLFFHP